MSTLSVAGIVAAVLGIFLLVLRGPLNSWNGRTWRRMAVDSKTVDGRDSSPYIVGVGALLLVGGVVLIIVGFAS